jgi:hypothetical protein
VVDPDASALRRAPDITVATLVNQMSVVTGAFQIVAVVIAVGGVAKIASPDGFSALLRTIGLPSGRLLARCSGVIEVALGVTATLAGGALAAGAVAAAYAVFAVAVIAARRSGAASCGCFGAVSAPPSIVHVVVNSVSAAIALVAVVAVPASLTDVLADQPLAGVPYLVAVAVGAWLVVVLDTTGAELLEQVAAVSALGPTFREHAATNPAAVPHSHDHDHGAGAARHRTGAS